MDNSNNIFDKHITHVVFISLLNRLHKVNVTELDDGKSEHALISCLCAILTANVQSVFFSRNQAKIMRRDVSHYMELELDKGALLISVPAALCVRVHKP